MQALSYDQFGGTDVLRLATLPAPAAEGGELLVRVKAAALNPIQWKFREGQMKMMSGKKFPQYVGGEFAGVVESVGSGITTFKPGDEVFGFVNRKRGGAMQEVVAVTPDLIAHKPANVSFAQAASICVTGTAAHIGLVEKAKIKSGQTILINGCTGGLGLWATQIARRAGLEVTGVCGTDAVDTARRLGCHHVVDYQREDVTARGQRYDIVLDAAHVLSFGDAKGLLNPGGTFLNPTPTPGQIVGSFFGNLLPGKKHHVILGAPDAKRIRQLGTWAGDGYEILVHKTFPLAQAREAFNYAEAGGYVGKVVVTMQ